MTLKKGGGRESGQARMKSESAQGVGQSDSAVANPAALEVWGGPRHHLVSECPCALCERLRALEAELVDFREWLDASHANQQDLVMERNDAVARAEKAEARVKELERKLKVSLIKQHLFKDDPRVSFRTAEMLMHIALDAPCLCIPNGEACLGHQFIRIWYEEKGALRDADPERVREADVAPPFTK